MKEDNIQELLKPRIIVENNYPRSPFKHHEIINEPTDEQIQWAKEFTLNFRFLNWWEYRDVKDMPEYLQRNTKDNIIFKAVKHNVDATHGLGFVTSEGKIKSYCNYLPTTETEYLNQNQKP